MLLNWILIALLILSLINLFRSFPYLINKKGNSTMSKHFKKRVLFSGLILFLLLIALLTGQINPNLRPY